MSKCSHYPFTAVVGQEEMKLALIINVINPLLKGVLVQGERGTAKSTAVRALAELLPDIEVVKGCPYNCDPARTDELCAFCSEKHSKGEKLVSINRAMQVVNLPINATEDRVAGSIDLEKAVMQGKQHFAPGILAKVHRGILYIDEVNLLSDHIIDLLLDVAAMGRNIVEREGISFSHLSRFILVGTMNPEEGDIRPQLTDRFDLSVTITGMNGVDEREAIVNRRLAFEADAHAFHRQWQSEQEALSDKIIIAMKNLSTVKIPQEIIRLSGQLAEELRVDGHRTEIASVKAAQAIASHAGRDTVEVDDLLSAVKLTFPHRLKKLPFDEEVRAGEVIDKAIVRIMDREGESGENHPVVIKKKSLKIAT
ncbi:MAG: ATP-binding protein [Spirochaetota bacterium]|nr:ATP-binding protein [Spirochaetota bacterium]